MKSVYRFLCFIVIFALSSCGFAEREQKIRDKETVLLQKEQELLTKEKELALKEADLATREMMFDSSKRTWDSIGVYNEKLVGEWNVTMNCTETNCEGSAIGDTKTEHWSISYENNQVVAKAFFKKKLLRIYKGIYSSGVLKLTEEENTSETEIMVELMPDTKDTGNKMKGTRTIVQPKCKIRYDLNVERITDNKNITNILK